MQYRKQPSSGRLAREQAIVRLIRGRRVQNQLQLGGLLARSGFAVNQATLSRDLRRLGILKGPQGYSLPVQAESGAAAELDLERILEQWLQQALVAQNQLLLKTPPGGAQPLAVAIDQSRTPLALGTIAGDDTILVICESAAKARKLGQQLCGSRLVLGPQTQSSKPGKSGK